MEMASRINGDESSIIAPLEATSNNCDAKGEDSGLAATYKSLLEDQVSSHSRLFVLALLARCMSGSQTSLTCDTHLDFDRGGVSLFATGWQFAHKCMATIQQRLAKHIPEM